MAAGTEGGVPTTKAGPAGAVVAVPAFPVAGGAVEKTTWGTVMAVERTVVVEDDGITLPMLGPAVSEQGTTRVVRTCTVVTGMEAGCVTPAEAETLEAPVTTAGLLGMYGAQIPWKKD